MDGWRNNRKRCQTLLADTNQQIWKGLGPFPEWKGALFTTVDNGAKAANLINQKNFDTLIATFQLSALTGMEDFQQIKKPNPVSRRFC